MRFEYYVTTQDFAREPEGEFLSPPQGMVRRPWELVTSQAILDSKLSKIFLVLTWRRVAE